jgi:hypothetical protein
MKYAVDMASGAVIYTRNFINIGSGICKLTGKTHRQQDDLRMRKNKLNSIGT